MSRHRPSGSKGHYIRRYGPDDFRLCWSVDRYYRDSRLRHPTACHRDTDRKGAERFARRWGCGMPPEPGVAPPG